MNTKSSADHKKNRVPIAIGFFTTLAFVLVTAHVVAVDLFHYLVHLVSRMVCNDLGGIGIVAMVGTGLFITSATKLYAKRLDLKITAGWMGWLTGLVLSGHWLALAVHELLAKTLFHDGRIKLVGNLVLAGLFLLLLALMRYLRERFGTYRTLTKPENTVKFFEGQKSKDRHIKALVLFVSKNSFEFNPPDSPSGSSSSGPSVSQYTGDENRSHLETISLKGTPNQIGEDITATNKFKTSWNWQPLLRAIQPFINSEHLRYVYLLGSRKKPGPDEFKNHGSSKQIDNCEKLLKQYLPKAIFRHVKDLDFENFNELLTFE